MTAPQQDEIIELPEPQRSTSKTVWWGLGLFLLTVIWVGFTSNDIGYTRDEGYYFKAGRDYFGWFAALGKHFAAGDFFKPFEPATIDRHWSYNHEHPVIVKTLFALSYGILKEGLHLFSTDGAAMRFVGWCFGGLTVMMTYLLALKLVPHRFALLSALLWLCMPRSFWHMHLACFDIPVVFAHLWFVHTYLKSQTSWKWALWTGVVLGLSAAIKHNVLFVPFIFVLHWLITQAKVSTVDRFYFRLPPIPLAFFAMIFIAPVVFILHWPYLWPDLIDRIQWYLNFHLDHEHYPILYFGELLVAPPFPRSFPFVMSAITIPVMTLTLIIIALFVSMRFTLKHLKNSRALSEDENVQVLAQPVVLVMLFLLNGLMPFFLISSPATPIFGGTKHWLNGVPFLIILGVWSIYHLLFVNDQNKRWQWPVMLMLILPSLTLTLRAHPYGLSSYNEVIGFARGAANAGFQRTFWGYEPMESWELINQRTPQNAKIHLGDTNKASYRTYLKDKIIRKDLRFTHRVKDAHAASVQPQGEFKKQWIDVWNQWKIRKPAGVVHIDGVPLSTVTFKP